MTSDAHDQDVDARLRQLAALSAERPRWPPLVEMTPEAVSARLRECAAISELATQLARAGRRGRG